MSVKTEGVGRLALDEFRLPRRGAKQCLCEGHCFGGLSWGSENEATQQKFGGAIILPCRLNLTHGTG